MKRKVAQIGPSTLMVSLPMKWVKENNVSKGDELNIIEDKHSLIINTSHKKNKLNIEINMSGLGSMLNRTICAIYKAGYTNINFKYSTSKELNLIQETLDRTCHVFEIMQIKNNSVEVNSISSLDENDFDKVLRKIGHVLFDIIKDTEKAIKNNDYAMMQANMLKDKIIDRHSDFCRRIINSGHTLNYKRLSPLYTIIEQTEVLADIYKSLNREICTKKINVKDDLIHLLIEVNKQTQIFFNCFYSFDLDKVKELGKSEINIRKFINLVCDKPRKDSKILSNIINIFETCFEMKSALITLHVGTDN